MFNIKKFFPYKQNIIFSDLMIDEESKLYITKPFDSSYIIKIIIKKLKNYDIYFKNINIVDSTACIGGDTINFSKYFNKIYAIEINEKWLQYLHNNVNVYKSENIIIMQGNSLELINTINDVDVVYIDPPWGGMYYKKINDIEIFINNKKINDIIPNYFVNNVKLLVIKLPKNYNINKFDILKNDYHINIFKFLRKMNIVTFEKNVF